MGINERRAPDGETPHKGRGGKEAAAEGPDPGLPSPPLPHEGERPSEARRATPLASLVLLLPRQRCCAALRCLPGAGVPPGLELGTQPRGQARWRRRRHKRKCHGRPGGSLPGEESPLPPVVGLEESGGGAASLPSDRHPHTDEPLHAASFRAFKPPPPHPIVPTTGDAPSLLPSLLSATWPGGGGACNLSCEGP